MPFVKRYLTKFAILAVLLLALFTRLYGLPEKAVFTADEEYQANIAMTLVRHFHIIWIGVSAANTDFYLGPYWSYFTAFLLLISKGDPLLLNYISALIGVITVFALCKKRSKAHT